ATGQPPLEALTAGYRAAFTVSAAVLATTALLAVPLTCGSGRSGRPRGVVPPPMPASPVPPQQGLAADRAPAS
ncbi:hypothetical protein ABZY81_34920, partial [Streptomyces sp. NPDC006514]